MDCFQHRINVTLDCNYVYLHLLPCPASILSKSQMDHLLYGNCRNKYIVNIMYISLHLILNYIIEI